MRITYGLLIAVVLLVAPEVAQGHTISRSESKRIVHQHVEAISADLAAVSPTAVAELSGVRSSCRPERGRGRHRHRARCRVSITVRDREGATHVANRTCRDRFVRLAVSRRGRLGVVARTLRLRCRLSATQPTPAFEGAPPAAEPVPVPAQPTPIAPVTRFAPVPSELPPGAPPPGPPPGVTASATAAAAEAGAARLAGSAAADARTAQTWPRPSYGFVGCLWRQISGWWIYDCYWRTGSSAPPGAHIIGWQSTYYYERYYWGYDGAGNLGVLPWYYGYFEH